MKTLYICAGIFLAGALIFSGIAPCWSDQGEIMSNAKLASLIFDMKKLQMPVDTEGLSEEEIYKIQADMLAAENIAQFVARELQAKIDNSSARVSRVAAWESDDACATYIVSRPS